MSNAPELSEAERIRVEAFGLDKPEEMGEPEREKAWKAQQRRWMLTYQEPDNDEAWRAGWNARAAQAVSLPDRTDLREVLATVLSRVAFSGSGEEVGTEQFAVLVSDAIDVILPVLAALSPASIPEIPDNSAALMGALRSRLSVAEAIISRARYCVREEYARDQIFAVLNNPLPPLPVLAALSTQPTAGDCEGTCDYYGGVCVTCGRAQPPELAELFPGTLAALDRLSIRPEAK